MWPCLATALRSVWIVSGSKDDGKFEINSTFLSRRIERLKKYAACSVDRFGKSKFPTDPFPISEPQVQEIGKLYAVHKRRATDFEAPKVWKGSSGLWNTWSEPEKKISATVLKTLKNKAQPKNSIIPELRISKFPNYIKSADQGSLEQLNCKILRREERERPDYNLTERCTLSEPPNSVIIEFYRNAGNLRGSETAKRIGRVMRREDWENLREKMCFDFLPSPLPNY